MGDRRAKEEEKKSRKRSSSLSDSEDEEQRRKRRRKEKSGKSEKKEKRKEKKSHKHRSDKEKKSKDKHRAKHSKGDKLANFKELSNDDYFLKNNEFATWLQEKKKVFFSDLSSESARELFSEFVKDWNNRIQNLSLAFMAFFTSAMFLYMLVSGSVFSRLCNV